MKIRRHGDYLFLDSWLCLFALFARVFARDWHRRWTSSYSTVSVVTATIYTPGGERPPARILRHEREHLRQRDRDGLIRFALRYVFSQRWRVRYESEAYRVDGTPWHLAVDYLLAGYLLTLDRYVVADMVRREYDGG